MTKYTELKDATAITGDERYTALPHIQKNGRHTRVQPPIQGAEIWYARPLHGINMRMGYDWLEEQSNKGYVAPLDYGGQKVVIPTFATLHRTHTLLGVVGTTDMDAIYCMMQGGCWSPQGQASDLITALDLEHTSMSVGDIIVFNTTHSNLHPFTLFMVDNRGFKELT
jgi:hypothetical protein